MVESVPLAGLRAGFSGKRKEGGRKMQITLDLIAGLPRKELIERIHYHQRQGELCLPPSVPPRGR